ncbi:hypothetical protein CQA66_08240 [Helicobacter aurati]|uniref:Uncharacterized protein n=1 Tax=Helicobacter aurati TaxID=137778 RepID=A0A3D8IYP3_9HELI|nr:hypothetical protein CQA66_08240 [Helicobacter aurati]
MNASEYKQKQFILNNKEYVLIKDVRYETDLLLNLYYYSICKGVEILKNTTHYNIKYISPRSCISQDMFILNFVKESYNKFIKLRSLLP